MTENNAQQPDGTEDALEQRDAPPRPAWHSAHLVLMVVGALALVMWLVSGVYRVGAGEVAVVERLGQYLTTPEGKILAVESGVHMGLPWPLDRVETIKVQATNKLTIDTFDSSPAAYAEMISLELRANVPPDVVNSRYNPYLITSDANVVHLTAAVQYRISDAAGYVSAVAEMPGQNLNAREELLRRVVEHEMVSTVSRLDVETVLYDTATVQLALKEHLQEAMLEPVMLDVKGNPLVDDEGKPVPRKLRFGIQVERVDLPQIRPPERVKNYFADVLSAKFDQKAMTDRAKGDKNAMVAAANATATNIVAEAEAYKSRVVETAKGEAERFKAVKLQYAKDPYLARYDLWQSTMKEVLGKANRVFYVSKDQTLYIPLPPPEKLVESSSGARPR